MTSNEAGFTLLAYFGFLDGKLTDAETAVLDNYLREHYQGCFSLLSIARTFVSKDIRRAKQKSRQLFESALIFLEKETDEAFKKGLLQDMVRLGVSEGTFCVEQMETFKKILARWKLSWELEGLKNAENTKEKHEEAGSSFEKIMKLAEKYENLFPPAKSKKKQILWMGVIVGVLALAALLYGLLS